MAYSTEKREEILKSVFEKLENGVSLNKILKEKKIRFSTFYNWINESEEKKEKYTRAKEFGITAIFDSIDDDYNDKPPLDAWGKVDSGWVAMQRLKIDAKKWKLSKLAPKKYGDKIDVTTQGEKLNSTPTSITVKVVLPEGE